jgi:hypothetical protein
VRTGLWRLPSASNSHRDREAPCRPGEWNKVRIEIRQTDVEIKGPEKDEKEPTPAKDTKQVRT